MGECWRRHPSSVWSSIMASDLCPVYSPFFGAMGCATAIALTTFGASYGTAKAGVGVMSAGILRPDTIVRSLMPILMAGIVAIYGLVISILISYVLGLYGMIVAMLLLARGAGSGC